MIRSSINAPNPDSISTKLHGGLEQLLLDEPDLEFAILVGSRADGTHHPDSDWDIALAWSPQLDWMTGLGKTKTLRSKMARAMDVAPDKIDLIDLARSSLAMRANVAESGIPLKGDDSLAWAHFLTRTWRELEDFYWEQAHAT